MAEVPNKKERRKAKRAEVVQALRDEGSISSSDAARLAKKLGLPESAPQDAPAINPPSPSSIRRTPLDALDKKRILECLESGFNRALACKTVQVCYQRFRKALIEDADFRSDVFVAEASCIGHAQAMIFSAALNQDMIAAEKFIRIRASADASVFTRKMNLAEMRQRQRVVDSQLGAEASDATPPVDFSAIPAESWEDYCTLCDAVAAGEDLDDEAAIRYARYQVLVRRATLAAAPRPAPGFAGAFLALPPVAGKLTGEQ